METDSNNPAAHARSGQATGYAFRAGDHVLHVPSSEVWELSTDEERGEVMPCGWPLCIAKASDCILVQSSTDDERRAMLAMWSGGGDDPRALAARRHNKPELSDGGKVQ